MESFSESYAKAGVDVTAGYESVELIKSHVKRTEIPGVMGSIGGFGGMFELLGAGNYKNPVLVSGTDGVGTKLKVAFLLESSILSVLTVWQCVLMMWLAPVQSRFSSLIILLAVKTILKR